MSRVKTAANRHPDYDRWVEVYGQMHADDENRAWLARQGRELKSRAGFCPIGRDGCPGNPSTLPAGKTRWRCLVCGAASEAQ